jgi:hypothetical protein
MKFGLARYQLNTERFNYPMKLVLISRSRPYLITEYLCKYFMLVSLFVKRTSRAKVKNIPDPRKIPIFAG